MSSKIVLNTQNTHWIDLTIKSIGKPTITAHKNTHFVLVRKKNDNGEAVDEFVLEERPITWREDVDTEPEMHTVKAPATAASGLAAVVAAVAGGGGGGGSTGGSSPYQDPVQTVQPVSSGLIAMSSPTVAPAAIQAVPPVVVAPAPVVVAPAPVVVAPAPVVAPTAISATVKLFDAPQYWLGDIYAVDLNRDGVDELILAGRKSQPSTTANWEPSYVNIMGWNTGTFANENDVWFSGSSNRILGTEPSVRFADFDGDGRTDIWIAPSTDMTLYGPGVVYFNTGTGLERHDLDIGDIWAHDSAVADINGDGLADIVAVGYGPGQVVAFGRPDRTFDVHLDDAMIFYSGVAAGDFLGDGSVTFVMVDTWGDGISDTALYELDQTTNTFAQLSVLPADRFSLPKHDALTWLDQPGSFPHSVRATTMDFNRDGLDDVVVSVSANGADGGWHQYFELQFLENQGAGNFLDKTDDVLFDWDILTTVSYNPVVRDVNGDGLLDLWLSAQDYNGEENSNRVLFAQPDGTFVQAWQTELAELRDDIGGNVSPVAWAQGPDQAYLASMVWDITSNHAEVKLIGDFIA